MAKKPTTIKTVESLKHDEATRKNIPTAEYQSVMQKHEQSPVRVAYERGAAGLDDAKERRNRDLDPQLVWRGKDEQDWSDLVVHAPPLYIQEKVHPKVLIDDLLKQTREQRAQEVGAQFDLFGDFNGIPEGVDKTEFYQHDQNWSNRLILGDSLQVMASLAEREGLRGKVQCIYLDPPYGIKFNSNFQWSTTSRDVKDGKADHITREPEQVKAFRDTWRDGIHSYLTYLRDRLTVARDLLTESGSIFVQIGDENVHRVRAVMDEVFGDENFVSLVTFAKTSGFSATSLPSVGDYLVWYGKKKDALKFRNLFVKRSLKTISEQFKFLEQASGPVILLNKDQIAGREEIPTGRRFAANDLTSPGESKESFDVPFASRTYRPNPGTHWRTTQRGIERLRLMDRLFAVGGRVAWKRYDNDFPYVQLTNHWADSAQGGMAIDKIYVVQTIESVIERCVLMTTDPGDLVLDPTCGSGTTATVAEQWGRRWLTIDTSRVALALARARIMGARYPYYLLTDSREGRAAAKAAAVNSGQWAVASEEELSTSHSPLNTRAPSVRQGFVYERVPHITLKSISNNAEIDVI